MQGSSSAGTEGSRVVPAAAAWEGAGIAVAAVPEARELAQAAADTAATDAGNDTDNATAAAVADTDLDVDVDVNNDAAAAYFSRTKRI